MELQYDEQRSNFAFNFNLRHYSGVLLTVQVSNKGDDLPTLCEWDRHVIKNWWGDASEGAVNNACHVILQSMHLSRVRHASSRVE